MADALTYTIPPSDYLAALQQWVASPTGGSKQAPGAPGPTPHSMDIAISPIHNADGSVTVSLIF